MALLRSRTHTTADGAIAPAGALDRALSELDQRLRTARDDGRQNATSELQARIDAAEKRAAEAEQAVERALAERTQRLESRLATLLDGLAVAAQRIEEVQAQTVRACETDVVRLALAVAAKVLAHAVDHDPEWMADVVARALNQIPDRRVIALRMHPSDAGLVRERHKELSLAAPNLGRLDIVDDAALEPGSVLLQSQGTTLDASLPGAWERIGMHLLQAAPHPACSVDSRLTGQ